MRLWPPATVLAIAALALAGCAREGPPAPVSTNGTEPPVRRAAPTTTATPAAPSRPASSHPGEITAGKGDTLYSISRRYDVPLRSLIDANHLDPPFQVAAGTKLILPQERYHIVRQGDTLYGVSRLYGVEVSTLASLNHLTAPYALKTGQTLILPTAVEPADRNIAAVPGTKPEFQTTEEAPPEKPGDRNNDAAPAPERPKPDMTATPRPPPRSGRNFDWPVEGRILARYGSGSNGTHNDGINIAARNGDPVHAADNGVVAYAGNELRGYGNLVLVKHAGGYMTAYAHNSQLLVKRGQVVKRGQEIAKAGSTGTVTTPQVHFEIRQGSKAIDPTNLLPSLRASAD